MKRNKAKVLILTDHRNHSKENSLYSLANEMFRHEQLEILDIASRGNGLNDAFFNGDSASALWVNNIDENFRFDSKNHPLSSGFNQTDISQYDLIWLRLPPPLDKTFLDFISNTFSKQIIINNPAGILETGSKEFLLNFPSVCPPMKICKSLEDIIEFKKEFAIVLKPFREYGGRGIVRINGDEVLTGNDESTFLDFSAQYLKSPIDYLAVKFLKNVGQGDKRIIVVNGEILGASLRLPPKDSWICNVSMGGSSNASEVTLEEEKIVDAVNPILTKMGIVMYGLDTLVGDDGKRVLSEINTTSIGGLPQIARQRNQPLVKKAIDLIWNYYEQTTNSK